MGYDASTGSFGTGFIQCVNPNTYSGPFVLQPYGGPVGIGTTNPNTDSKLDVRGYALSDNPAFYAWDNVSSYVLSSLWNCKSQIYGTIASQCTFAHIARKVTTLRVTKMLKIISLGLLLPTSGAKAGKCSK